ncbi:hypothetical protein AS026_24425 [Rhizobium altiplani]|uniref:Uncharacterized protein n=2 Tax=Rhizobium TaxID=379 RepID=K0Q0P9_9HYPH|nr:hypothetical protein AS026_24425 [Rhizobium altiplani]CCM79918.1 hypothetical protein BN77_p2140012 [Rhizobium mesoamericanum STM3625]
MVPGTALRPMMAWQQHGAFKIRNIAKRIEPVASGLGLSFVLLEEDILESDRSLNSFDRADHLGLRHAVAGGQAELREVR